MLNKLSLRLQVALAIALVGDSVLFYGARGDEELSILLYVLMFLALLGIFLSLVVDLLIESLSRRSIAPWIACGLSGYAVLFLGSETDALFFKSVLFLVTVFLLLHILRKKKMKRNVIRKKGSLLDVEDKPDHADE